MTEQSVLITVESESANRPDRSRRREAGPLELRIALTTIWKSVPHLIAVSPNLYLREDRSSLRSLELLPPASRALDSP
jgi:hypothetical protein